MPNIKMCDPKGGGVDLTKPFYTYEFSIATDQNYQDATGTETRIYATWTPGQAFLDKVESYNIPANTYPFNPGGRPRFLCVVRPKNASQIVVPDSTYRKAVRRDMLFFFSSSNRYTPYWRGTWRIQTDGSLAYSGGFSAANDNVDFELKFGIGTMTIGGQLSVNGSQMIAAGDYVVEFYDMTWTSLLGGT